MDDFSKKIEKGEPILFSEILERIPSDEVLLKLFPDPYSYGKSSVTHFGLRVLKLRLQGLKLTQIAETLQATNGRVNYWSQMTMNSLYKFVPDHVVVDIPALRRMLHIKPIVNGGYTKLSELLHNMPSDEELEKLDRERGNLDGHATRRRVTQKDLYILRQRLDGRSYESLCAELGWSRVQIRRNMQATRKRLIRDLQIELDVPKLFKPYKPGCVQTQSGLCTDTHDKIVHILGEHIIAYRKEHGESVAQFAKNCGVSASSIRKIEKGIGDPLASLVWKIARHIGVEMDDLFR